MSHSSKTNEAAQVRIRLFMIGAGAALLFLLAALFKEQILLGARYRTNSTEQSLRRVRTPGDRGRIFDRNYVCMADNRACYNIVVYVEELRAPGRWSNTINRVESVIDQAVKITGLPKTIQREDIVKHIRRRLPLPLVLWSDIKHPTMARFEERSHLEGMDLLCESVRMYPLGHVAAHVLGYVGKTEARDEDDDVRIHYYVPELDGREGIEKSFDSVLQGLPGGMLITVDASGFRRNVVREQSGRGEDLILTIDARIQSVVEETLAGVRGAAVILDPRNGDVIAMASHPDFDPNEFSPAIPAQKWKRLLADPAKPMVNRALCGNYAPGSTFKPVVALAALVSGKATAGTSFACDGSFNLGPVRFGCWQKRGHGMLNLTESIEQSCNSFFCQLGRQCGYDAIYAQANSLGFGHRTGIDLSGETSGLLPNEAWKRKVLKDSWRPGDTCNLSIGQGALLVSPLQLAVFTSAIANGGYIYKPRLAIGDRNSGELLRKMKWTPETIRVVRQGMHNVVQSDHGTGKRARVDGVELAGKTGTAEYGKKEDRKKHTWMLAFGPYQEPRYAMAMIVEDGDSGGITVAPRIKKIMTEIFTIEGLIKKDAGMEPVRDTNVRNGENEIQD